MKANQLKFIAAGFIFIGMLSCDNSTERKQKELNEANAEVLEATLQLDQAILDSTEDYKEYMLKAELKLAENEALIAKLKADNKASKKAVLAENAKELALLEEKNIALKLKIAEPKENAKDKWENFKTDFNKEMDELGKAISARANKNMNN